MHKERYFLLLLAGLLLLSGCAKKAPFSPEKTTPEIAFSTFSTNYCNAPPKSPFMLSGSLRYTRVKPAKRSNLTKIRLWGELSRPLRLDVSAAIGRMLTHIREDESGLTAFYPDQNAAYTHPDPVVGASLLGMPFPFSIQDLALLLSGTFAHLVPNPPATAGATSHGFIYTFSQGPVSLLELDGWARPIRIQGTTSPTNNATQNWSIHFSRYLEEGTSVAQPHILSLTLGNGESGVLRIYEQEWKKQPWSQQALDLPLPQGAKLFLLNAPQSMEEGT